jgi:hypothetical protein
VEGGSGSGCVVGEEELVVEEAVGGEVLAVGVLVDVVGEVALGEEGDLEGFVEGELVAEAVEGEACGEVVDVVEAAVGLEEAVDGAGVVEVGGEGLAQRKDEVGGEAFFEVEAGDRAEGFFLDGIDGGRFWRPMPNPRLCSQNLWTQSILGTRRKLQCYKPTRSTVSTHCS